MRGRQTVRRTEGFSLTELMVVMAVMGIVMAGTMSAMTEAIRAGDNARAVTSMNANLRTGVDLMVRDFIQVGQGLLNGGVVFVPTDPTNAGLAAQVVRPGPPGANLTFPIGTTTINAVEPGPSMGGVINGTPTDMISVLEGDNDFSQIEVTALGADTMTVRALTVGPPRRGANISDGGADDINVGDLILLEQQTRNCFLYVTSVNGQVVRFQAGASDLMNLNQYNAALDATFTQFDKVTAAAIAATRATRVRMLTYYVDVDPNDPTQTPRLWRRLNMQAPRTVSFAVENFQLTYDLVDGVTNPANVQMDANDLAGGGACSPNPCGRNVIRKVNVFLQGRSRTRLSTTNDFTRNTLSTQVSFRSLALVDRYTNS